MRMRESFTHGMFEACHGPVKALDVFQHLHSSESRKNVEKIEISY
jgi:hypothetical protein